MWAIDSGRISPELKTDMVEFLFLHQFGITPENTRKMDNIDVEKMMWMLECVKKKESPETSSDRRRMR